MVLVPKAASSRTCGERVIFAKNKLILVPGVKVIDPVSGQILLDTGLSAVDVLA